MEKIFIGNNLLERIDRLIDLSRFSRVGVLSDKNVASFWLKKIKKGIGRESVDIIVPPGETTKNIDHAKLIWKKLLDAGFDRQSLLINLGGGMIGDLGGFAASTFMRGIDFLQIPTSLLAMVDASVGGKTAVNLDNVKNIIGTFTLPISVVIDIKTLSTLPQRELIAAFGEIIKHSIIDTKTHFNLVTVKKPSEFNQKELLKIVKESVRLKRSIVQQDFKEITGLRRALNFGHTIGHAIESLSLITRNPLLHGEAVAIGMVAESKLAQLLGLLSSEDFVLIENAIKKVGLPTRMANMRIENVQKLILSDKKNKSGNILWSLPERIGSVKFDIKAPEALIAKAINYISI